MKKNNSKIRSNFVKESLMDYNNLAETLKENTADAVKSIFDEEVRKTYADILNESEDEEDKDYDVGEVEDTESNDDVDAKDENAEGTEGVTDTEEPEGSEDETKPEEETPEDETPDNSEDGVEKDGEGNDDEWSEFDNYKVGDNKYDFSNAKDDEIVKVYKLLKDDDQVNVIQDKDNIQIKDNETGAEYIIQKNDNGEETPEEEPEENSENDMEDNNDNMNESRLFEIVLEDKEGYTDNYQDKDVMTGNNVNEPSKSGRDWDKGVPHTAEKPWSKVNKKAAPFNKEASTVTEEEEEIKDESSEEPTMEEATNVGGFVQQNSTVMSHIPNSKGRNARNARVAGVKTKGTSTPRYNGEAEAATNEAILKKANKILKENQELKDALGKFKSILSEAAVTNLNLGGIIKLMTENATSTDEKKEIVRRFGAEAHTIDESKNLYTVISNELKNKPKPTITEAEQISAEGSKRINESKIYQDEDIISSLDLMHRMKL